MGDLGWMCLGTKMEEKRLIYAGWVAGMDEPRWSRAAWEMGKKENLPWFQMIGKLEETYGTKVGEGQQLQGVLVGEVKRAFMGVDGEQWVKGVEEKSSLQHYGSETGEEIRTLVRKRGRRMDAFQIPKLICRVG